MTEAEHERKWRGNEGNRIHLLKLVLEEMQGDGPSWSVEELITKQNAVLDEPCSAVEPAFEAAFFAALAAESGITVVTVAHRAELAAHHTHELRLDGQGGATFQPTQI